MNRKITLLVSLLCLACFFNVKAQCPPNIDFELGTTTNWLCYTGTIGGTGVITVTTLSGPIVGRHTITSGTGVDPYGFFPVVAPSGGGTYSLQLGNDINGAQAERVRYNVHVPSGPGIYSMIYRYAVVLENPGHGASIQPRMLVKAYDSITGVLVPCDSYLYVSSASIPGFLLSPTLGTGGSPVYYKTWTMGNLKFPGMGGRTVTVDFTTTDCGAGGHFGYGYVDMTCGMFANTLINCAAGAVALSGPDGYSTYTWYDSATFSTYYGGSQVVTITAPTVTTTYAVVLVPYTGYGCPDTLYTRVVPSTITLAPSHDTAICSGASVTLSAGATTTSMPMTYSWSPSTGLSCTTCSSTTATPTTTTSYTVTVNDAAGCTRSAAITVTVVPTPAPIGGPATVCPGSTVIETDAVSGGVWSCGPTTVATIGASSGVLTGVNPGTATVIYTTGGICFVSRTVTVSTNPAAITGTASVCIGQTTTLADATPGGTWTSGTPSVATVGSSSGIVTGVAAGTAPITYTVTSSGCFAVRIVTVYPNPLPIAGPSTLCVNANATYSSVTAGGTWSCSPTTNGTIVSTTGVLTGLSAGVCTVTYSLTSTGCYVTFPVTINALPAPITGPTHLCEGVSDTFFDATPGGTWSVTTPTVGYIDPVTGILTTVAAGLDTIYYTAASGCRAAFYLTVDPPPAISGPTGVCVNSTIVLSSPGTVTWSSSNPAIATVGSSSGVVTGVAAGLVNIICTSSLGCTNTYPVIVYALPAPITGPSSVCVGSSISLSDATTPGIFSTTFGTIATTTSGGVVTGVTTGVAIITYTESVHSCSRTTPVTVNSTPGPILGTLGICPGQTTTLTCTPSGGTWVSSSTTIATIGSTTGIASGSTSGVTNITYTLGGTCYSVATLTVYATPPPISPTSPQVCVGSNITLTDAAGPGLFTASCPALSVTIGGVVTGLATGTCTVTYTVSSTGCSTTRNVTVNPLPGAITPSPASVCIGQTLPLASTPTGGTWSSLAPLIGSVSPVTGIAGGVAAGTATIRYTLPTGCFTSTVLTVNGLPTAYAVTGGGSRCASGAGVSICLANSQTGVSYDLMNGTTVVATLTGTGSSICFTGITAAGTYTIKGTNTTTTCSRSMTGSAVVTVNPDPLPIVGASAVCAGQTTVWTDGMPGGSWLSGSTAVATLSPTTGSTTTVTGVTAGLSTTITYTIIATGCFTTKAISVTAAPGPIIGPAGVCQGQTVTLSNSVPGGTWASSNPAIGTIDMFTGVTGGIATGTFVVTYSLGSGCQVFTTLNVTSAPLPIVGPTQVCVGDSIHLTDGTPGGLWSVGPTSAPYASVNSLSGWVRGLSVGVATITYTSLAGSGCPVFYTVTVNGIPGGILGSNQVCVSSCNPALTSASPGGAWTISSSVATIGATSGVLCGVSAGTATVSYTISGCVTRFPVTVNALPSTITGSTFNVCQALTITVNATPAGGTWASSAPGTASITPGPINPATITGGATGVATITYTLPTGCQRTGNVTVNTSPAPISGTGTLCQGQTTMLTDPTPGGVWSSSNPAVASITSGGLVTASSVSSGSLNITYTVGTCSAVLPFTVVPPPLPITPSAPNVCVGGDVILSSPTTGGSWMSGAPGLATVTSSGPGSGIVHGVSSGTVIISYGAAGCFRAVPVVVNPIAPILGNATVCQGQTTHLTDTALGGTWISLRMGVALVNPSGVVTGVATGSSTADTATIIYVLPTGCVASQVVTVNPVPTAITPAMPTVCVGQTLPLISSPSGGTWTSANPAVATIDAVSGVVSGVNPGTSTITYTMSGPTGCFATKIVTVNSNPSAISGPNDVCLGLSISLSSAPYGGTWSSSTPSIATVTPVTGVVTANPTTPGTTTIFYSLATGCGASKVINVIDHPNILGTPPALCQGQTATLTASTTGGTWSSASPGIATIDLVTGVVTALTAGTAAINYTIGTGCSSTTPFIVTVNVLPGISYTTTNLCIGSTYPFTALPSGGVWTTSDPLVATVSPTGLVTSTGAGVALINYQIPATGCFTSVAVTSNVGPSPISGTSMICLGQSAAFTDGTPGGTWSSSDPSIAPVDPMGIVYGSALGTATISYTVPGFMCPAVQPIAVNPLPTTIGGPSDVCEGQSITMTNGVPGGVWSSSAPGVAAIDAVSGVVTAAVLGSSSPTSVTIYYTLGAGCDSTKIINVNPLPLPISGPNTVCQGQTITVFDATIGGAWSSGSPAVGTVDPSGNVTGVAAGVAPISYTNTYGCSVDYPVTVNAAPGPILGSANVCFGSTTTLSNAVGGGVWASANPAIASVGATTGVVTGVSLGTTTISYTIGGLCTSSINITVFPLPTVYNVTGGGNRCPDDAGVHIGLSGSAIGVIYFVYRGGTTAVGSFAGTGTAMDFGLFTVGGTYTVEGINTATTCRVAMAGSASINVLTPVVPSVTMAVSPNDTVCAGTSVSYTPAVVNGGSSPSYVWKVNGYPVAVTPTYTFIPADGDSVTVSVASSATCATPAIVSRSMRMTVQPFANPVLDFAVTPNDTVCQGQAVVINAVPTYGGPGPIYTWVKNGAPMSGTGGSFTYVPNNGDVIYAVLYSNYPCRLANTDSSDKLTISVDTPRLPVVTIHATPGEHIGLGQTLTLTATVVNAVAPTYQWYINGVPQPSGTSSTFTYSSYSYPKQDSVSCAVTSHDFCTVTSHQWVYVDVSRVGVQQVSLANSITVLPNPNKGEFIVKGSLSTVNDEEVTLELTNMVGQVVYSEKVIAKGGKLDKHVALSKTLANGMYILSLKSDSDSGVFHVVIEQ